jgi:tryptophan synthase alpha chain
MNRISSLFLRKKNILSIYFTAGFPKQNDTVDTIAALVQYGTDLIEIGIPFSDPLADGPVIQQSSEQALANGMSLKLLFEQLGSLGKARNRENGEEVPLILMGYLNPVMQYGMEAFCKKARELGIDGVILPDLPLQEYLDEYKTLFEKYGLINIFLITPQTSPGRIRFIDEHSEGFIYMVSSASTTGAKSSIGTEQISYFERIRNMKLRNPVLIGFGISDRFTFSKACEYAPGAIIGSAFVKALSVGGDLNGNIHSFIEQIRPLQPEKINA